MEAKEFAIVSMEAKSTAMVVATNRIAPANTFKEVIITSRISPPKGSPMTSDQTLEVAFLLGTRWYPTTSECRPAMRLRQHSLTTNSNRCNSKTRVPILAKWEADHHAPINICKVHLVKTTSRPTGRSMDATEAATDELQKQRN